MIFCAFHQDEVVHVTKADLESECSESTLNVEHRAFDIMALPYLFAAMNLEIGDRFAIPIHSPFQNAYGYLHINVAGTETITLATGQGIKTLRVEYYSEPSRERACELIDLESRRVTVTYYVSKEPPYWIKQRIWTKVLEPTVDRSEMILEGWQDITVNATNLHELLAQEE